MEVIKSYLTIVDPVHFDCLKGKARKLVQAIRASEVATDEEARKLFDFSDRSYNKLKNKVKRVLMSYILLSEHGNTEVQKAYNYCHQGRATSMILLGKGAKKEGIELARKVFRKADEFGFVHIANELSAEISQHYSTVEPNVRLRKKYIKYSEKYLRVLVAQTRAQRCYSEVVLALGGTASYTKAAIRTIDKHTDLLESYKNIDSPRTQFYLNSLLVIKNFSKQKYLSVIEVCKRALRYLNGVKSPAGYRAGFLLHQGMAQTAVKDFSKAAESLEQAQKLVVKNKVNWQMIALYRTILALHAARYDQAYSLYQEGLKKDAPEFLKERWRMVGAYIYLLSRAEKLYTGRTRFGIGKFLNETANSSLDKMGFNINIIIIELLLLLQQKRYSEFIDRMDGLQSYLYRHTRDKSTKRARLFLKMISSIPKFDFHSRSIDYEMTTHFRKLRRMPVYASHNWEIELLPFEVLWEMVIDLLDNRKRALAV